MVDCTTKVDEKCCVFIVMFLFEAKGVVSWVGVALFVAGGGVADLHYEWVYFWKNADVLTVAHRKDFVALIGLSGGHETDHIAVVVDAADFGGRAIVESAWFTGRGTCPGEASAVQHSGFIYNCYNWVLCLLGWLNGSETTSME